MKNKVDFTFGCIFYYDSRIIEEMRIHVYHILQD